MSTTLVTPEHMAHIILAHICSDPGKIKVESSETQHITTVKATVSHGNYGRAVGRAGDTVCNMRTMIAAMAHEGPVHYVLNDPADSVDGDLQGEAFLIDEIMDMYLEGCQDQHGAHASYDPESGFVVHGVKDNKLKGAMEVIFRSIGRNLKSKADIIWGA